MHNCLRVGNSEFNSLNKSTENNTLFSSNKAQKFNSKKVLAFFFKCAEWHALQQIEITRNEANVSRINDRDERDKTLLFIIYNDGDESSYRENNSNYIYLLS